MTKEMSESAPRNPFRRGQAAAEPQISGSSVLSDEQRADVHALRASRRAQQAAVSAGPIDTFPEVRVPTLEDLRAYMGRARVTHEPRAPIRAIASRAVHKAQERLTELQQFVQSRRGSSREPEPGEQEPYVLDVTVPSSQPETEDILSIETSDELLGRLLTELEVLKDQYYEGISPQRATIELAKKLGLGGNTDEERIAKIRAAYNQALDHASDEAFDRFEKGLQNGRLDRLWIPTAQLLRKESQQEQASTPPAEESESAQGAEAAQAPAPPPSAEAAPVETEQTPAEWEPTEEEAKLFLYRMPEAVQDINDWGWRLRNYRNTHVAREDIIWHVAQKMGIRGDDFRVMINELTKRYGKAANVAELAYDDMRRRLHRVGLFPVWLDWISPYIVYSGGHGGDIPGAGVYETADPENRWAPWREGLEQEHALFVEPGGAATQGAVAKSESAQAQEPEPTVREAVVTPQPKPDEVIEPYSDWPQESSKPDELPPMLEAHELIPLLKNAGLADKTPQELFVISDKLHRDLAAYLVDRMYKREQTIVTEVEQQLRPEIEAQMRLERFEEDEAIERMNQWVDLMIEFPRRYPEDFPDPNNLNTDAFFKRLVELQERAGVDSDDMIRNEDDLVAAVEANVAIMRTAFAKAFMVSFNRSGFGWSIVREEGRET